MSVPITRSRLQRPWILAVLAYLVLAACMSGSRADAVRQHRWWSGLGAVLPHDSFPADCTLCHLGSGWHTLTGDFAFDHGAETGHALDGAHAQAQCLRCHNDRGPVEVFAARGCAGCHEDQHLGRLGPSCTECHTENTWQPYGQFERHRQTRFPLEGVHAAVSCRRCHIGAEVGNFRPVPIECADCHQDDLIRTGNHIGLGWNNSCDRCHQPTSWERAELDPNF